MPEKVTADEIRTALESAYSAPEWYLGFEVGNSTGAGCRRHADAVAINAYASKGFEIRGFEIKVSKSDLKSELENGIKSDEIARFCDHWFLVVPKGLTDGFTIPPTWGIIEWTETGLRQKKKAELLEKQPLTPGFVCAMMRGRERTMSGTAAKASEELRNQIRREVSYSLQSDAKKLVELREKLEEIKSATGISLDTWEPAEHIIRRLKAAEKIDLVSRKVSLIQSYAKDVARLAKEAESAANSICADEQEDV